MKYIFADTETTGLNPEKDEILSLAIVDDKQKVVLNQLFKPEHIREWPEAQAIHRISPQMVQCAPTFRQFLPILSNILFDPNNTVVFYNSNYDAAFINKYVGENKKWRIACAMTRFYTVANSLGHRPQKGLNHYYKLCDALKIAGYSFQGKGAHDALADAIACSHIWQWCDKHDPQPVIKGERK